MTAFVFEVALKSSLLVSAAALVDLLLRRRSSAAVRHLTWVLVVVGLLALPVLTAVLPRWSITIPAWISAARLAPQQSAQRGTVARFESSAEEQAVRDSANGPIQPIDSARAQATWSLGLIVVYASGVAILLGRLARGRRTARRLAGEAADVHDGEWLDLLADCSRRMGVDCSVVLLRSREHAMPMTMGTRRPAILIPAVADTWDTDRRRAVLDHELAHIVRRDTATQMLAALASAIYWPHPGVWWAAHRLRIERELACDDRVLAAGTPARDYAGHLLDLAYTMVGHRAPALAMNMARPRRLEGRLRAALETARNRTTPTLRVRLAAIAIACGVLVPLAVARARVAADRPSAAARVPATAGAPSQSADVPPAAAIAGNGQPGTWEVRRLPRAGFVQLRLNEDGDSSYGTTMRNAAFDGLTAALDGPAAPVRFTLPREAGTFVFDGTLRSGVGAGTYSFAASAGFVDELKKRGFGTPTNADLYLLARSDVGLAFVDELETQGYVRPTLEQIVRAAQNGLNRDYVREMGELGYRLGRVEALIAQANFGVSPGYVRALRAQGLADLGPDDLLRARAHGVTPEYAAEMRALGHALDLDALVHARARGISPAYDRGLQELGYRFGLDELAAARAHGVSVEYITSLRDYGYGLLSLEELIEARNHGVSPEYVGDLRQLGYDLSLDELILARNHGVEGGYIVALQTQGLDPSLEELTRLRSHGVTPEDVLEVRQRTGRTPTVDGLVRRKQQGDMTYLQYLNAHIPWNRLHSQVRMFMKSILE